MKCSAYAEREAHLRRMKCACRRVCGESERSKNKTALLSDVRCMDSRAVLSAI